MIGLQPGPMLFATQQDFVWTIFGSFYIGNLALVVITLAMIPLLASCALVRPGYLYPAVIGIVVLGVYSRAIRIDVRDVREIGCTIGFGLGNPALSDEELLAVRAALPILINQYVGRPKGVRPCRPSADILDLLQPSAGGSARKTATAMNSTGSRFTCARRESMSTIERLPHPLGRIVHCRRHRARPFSAGRISCHRRDGNCQGQPAGSRADLAEVMPSCTRPPSIRRRWSAATGSRGGRTFASTLALNSVRITARRSSISVPALADGNQPDG
ncbi:tripartite tricarboxylate transporter permease [Paracoccus mutanolyticus]|uniref:tripartite tricarboxylate transporter permease n=1 Tax=Paracoccus mutanolyticus TaxID=1499308 RepID=UPI0037C6E892